MNKKQQNKVKKLKKKHENLIEEKNKEIIEIENEFETKKNELIKKYENNMNKIQSSYEKGKSQPALFENKMKILSFIKYDIFNNLNTLKNNKLLGISFPYYYSTNNNINNNRSIFLKNTYNIIFDLNPSHNNNIQPTLPDYTKFFTMMNPQISTLNQIPQNIPSNYFSRAISDQVNEYDQKIIQKMKKQKYKLQQINEQFNNSYGNINSVLKQQLDEVTLVCDGYKKLFIEQNKVIHQMVTDFQQQTIQLTRNFNSTINDLELSYRNALTLLSNNQQQNVNHNNYLERKNINNFKPLIRSRKVEIISEDSMEFEFEKESEADKILKEWKKESKKTERSSKRVKNQFEQLKSNN